MLTNNKKLHEKIQILRSNGIIKDKKRLKNKNIRRFLNYKLLKYILFCMREIKILFLYPPEQSWPNTMVKPNGSLAYPYLGGALRDIGVESYVYDACVGNDDDNLNNFFYKSSSLSSGMVRTGVSDDRILEIANDYDAVGITSIFSQQETQVLHCAKIIKKKFPNKLLFSGGVNAKSRSSVFFASSFDIIFE